MSMVRTHIESYLGSLSDWDEVEVWNRFARENDEKIIYSNDSDGYVECFNDDVAECSRAMLYGSQDSNHNYFYINNYGNVVSFISLTFESQNSPYDRTKVVDWLVENETNIKTLNDDFTLYSFLDDTCDWDSDSLRQEFNKSLGDDEQNNAILLNTPDELVKINPDLISKGIANGTYDASHRYVCLSRDDNSALSFDELDDEKSPYSEKAVLSYWVSLANQD